MTGPRIPLLGDERGKSTAITAGMPEGTGTSSIMQVLLYCPTAARHVWGLIYRLLNHGVLPRRLTELMILRIGWLAGAEYEWTQHWHIALEQGVPESDALGVRDWRAHPGFDDAERAALAAVDDVVSDGAISDDVWASLDQCFSGPEELVELVLVIGNWHMISGVLRSLRIPLEPGTAPWPPDGVAGGRQSPSGSGAR